MKFDAVNITKYEGHLVWEAASTTIGQRLEIPLFIKDHPIPIRKPKVTEIHTVDTRDHRTGTDVSTHVLFAAAPEILQVSISGWLITPWIGTRWDPKNDVGTSIYATVGNLHYGEIIGYLLEGRYGGRKDPDYYYSPYGMSYEKPVISTWDFGVTVNPRKQTFQSTIFLER